MPQFKQYQTSENSDGTINVHDLEIFKLGKHKGHVYDNDWAEAAVTNHADLEKNGYLPSVIIGHNDGSAEKPSKGFLSQLRKTGNTLIANLTKIPKETFEALKKREFPHRSVEVNPEARRFTALALLGGTAPFHKLPVMEFGETKGCQVIEFQEKEPAADPETGKLTKIFEDFKAVIEKFTVSIKNENNPQQTKEGNPMPEPITLTDEHVKLANQQFAESNGMTPQEAIDKLAELEKEAGKRAAGMRKQQIKMFVEQLKSKYFVAPKIVDEVIQPFLEGIPLGQTVKFGEEDKDAYTSLEEALTEIFKSANEESLIVPSAETTKHGDLGDPLDINFADEGDPMENRHKLDKKIESYAEKHNISYSDAALKVVE